MSDEKKRDTREQESKKTKNVWIALCALATVVFGPGGFAVAWISRGQQVDEAQQQAELVQKERDRARQERDARGDEVARLEQTLADVGRKVDSLQKTGAVSNSAFVATGGSQVVVGGSLKDIQGIIDAALTPAGTHEGLPEP